MNYKVLARAYRETVDMGIRNRSSSLEEVAAAPGTEFLGGRAKVISFDGETLVFSFMGQTLTVMGGHTWHSPQMGVHNDYIQESVSFSVSVVAEIDPKDEKKAVARVESLIEAMRKNTREEGYPVWKNIPLAKEMLDILHNKINLGKGKYIDASGITVCCDCIFLEDLLNQRDVPRLCLEFLQLRKIANDARTKDDQRYPSERYLGVIEADRIQSHLDFYIDLSLSNAWWLEHCSNSHLKFDEVERTKEWEDNIYEVEKEVDEALKGVPRGMGFCHAYWPAKRAALAKKGIEWRSPSQMNPRVMFD